MKLLTDTPTNSGHCITSLADVTSPYTIYSIQTIDLNFVIAFYAYAGHWAKEASGKAVILSGCGYTWLYASVRLSVSSFSNFIYPLNVNAWTYLMQTHHN